MDARPQPEAPPASIAPIETGEGHSSCNIPQPLTERNSPANVTSPARAGRESDGCSHLLDAAVPVHLETAMFAVG